MLPALLGGLTSTVTELVFSIRKSQDAFEVASLCLRFSYQHLSSDSTFDATDPRIHAIRLSLFAQINYGNASFLDTEPIAAEIETSDTPALAARAAAIALSDKHFNDFAASFSQLNDDLLEQGSVIPVPYRAPRTIYADKILSMLPGDTRHRNDPSRTISLKVWTADTGPNAVRVELDLAAGAYLESHLAKPNDYCVAVVQPNVSMDEFDIEVLDEQVGQGLFFGLAPVDRDRQRTLIATLLSKADSPSDGGYTPTIALLPELSGSEQISSAIQEAQLKSIKMVISPSYHHIEDGEARNTADIIFPQRKKLSWRHHKSGAFDFKMTSKFREILSKADASMEGKRFVEDIRPSKLLRLLLGGQMSVMVLICSDFLDGTVQAALRQLRPTLILVSSMTQEVDDFARVGGDMVAAGQSTTIVVNNPRIWPDGSVSDALVCTFPLSGSQQHGVLRQPFTDAPAVAVLDLPTTSVRVLP